MTTFLQLMLEELVLVSDLLMVYILEVFFIGLMWGPLWVPLGCSGFWVIQGPTGLKGLFVKYRKIPTPFFSTIVRRVGALSVICLWYILGVLLTLLTFHVDRMAHCMEFVQMDLFYQILLYTVDGLS